MRRAWERLQETIRDPGRHSAYTIENRVLPLERLPYRATAQSAAYDRVARLPVCVLLDNVRSLYNVGAFFRTADAAGIEKLYLSGITGTPPKKAISKTALGAEETVAGAHVGARVVARRFACSRI